MKLNYQQKAIKLREKCDVNKNDYYGIGVRTPGWEPQLPQVQFKF